MKKYPLLVIVLSFFWAANIHAASFEFASGSGTFQVDQMEQINVLVRSADRSINAVEGTVVFPADVAQLVEIKQGSSIVSFWATAPTQAGNKISFSGVIPGGFQGEEGHLFSLVVLMKDSLKKPSQFTFTDVQVLLNDGLGTPDFVAINPLTFSLEEKTAESSALEESLVNDLLGLEDIDPPESFVPLLSDDINLVAGQNVLVFSTQDKGSGISHYEIYESSAPVDIAAITDGWTVQTSPYVLKDQTVSGYVYIKAVDNQGNERIVRFPAEELRAGKIYVLWVVGILVLVILVIVLLKTQKNKNEK